jgi:hypothetical protein
VEGAACPSETLVQDYKASHPEDPDLKTSKFLNWKAIYIGCKSFSIDINTRESYQISFFPYHPPFVHHQSEIHSKERIGGEANQSPIVLLSHLLSCFTDENAGSGCLFPKVLPTMGVTDRTTITSRLQVKWGGGGMAPLAVMPPPLFPSNGLVWACFDDTDHKTRAQKL